MIGRLGLGCLVAATVLIPARAETPVPPERPRDERPASPPDADAEPPYEGKLQRLAELIGTLAFLRELCVPGEGAVWRAKMVDLLAAEGTTDLRRDRLAGAFNRGFDDYRITYRTCTASAATAIERAMTEGSGIAQDLSARFGG